MRGKHIKDRKRQGAQDRENERKERTNEEQLALLSQRPGLSLKERGKLA